MTGRDQGSRQALVYSLPAKNLRDRSGTDRDSAYIEHGSSSAFDTEPLHAQRTTGRVAIVEDDPSLAELYLMLIRKLGFSEEFVGFDGVEVVEALAESSIKPDVILMDYRMPRMNGLDAAQRIMENHKGIRIILATADDSVIEKARRIGIETLQKPFSIAQLKMALEGKSR